jgi:uncharacterized membrane protein YhiD involved in acid resistance
MRATPHRILTAVVTAVVLLAGMLAFAPIATAQTPFDTGMTEQHGKREHEDKHLRTPVPMDFEAQIAPVKRAAVSLPIAALLAATLAFRPRRRGTPRRTPAVIQTQIILALVGAVVMLIVGQSLARAFGIVGAAGLVRYRAKIDDPKDAGVMLSTLALGLACGVGLFALAGFATVLILGVLWAIESLEPEEYKLFTLKVTTKDADNLRPRVERLLQQHGVRYELRGTNTEDVCYEVKLPWGLRTDRISNAIMRLDGDNTAAVEWDEKKKAKA